eukprot:9487394-Pyramimonas_sp.AAC.1
MAVPHDNVALSCNGRDVQFPRARDHFDVATRVSNNPRQRLVYICKLHAVSTVGKTHHQVECELSRPVGQAIPHHHEAELIGRPMAEEFPLIGRQGGGPRNVEATEGGAMFILPLIFAPPPPWRHICGAGHSPRCSA